MIFHNVIDKNGKRTGGKIFSLVTKNDSLIEVGYIYGTDVISLPSTNSLIPGKELASIPDCETGACRNSKRFRKRP